MNTPSNPGHQQKAGERAYRRGDYLEAAQAFQAAAQAFRNAGDPLAAAEAANNRSVALLQAGENNQALDALNGTVEVFAEAGDVRRQALALGNQAAALHALKRYAEAEQAYRQSGELLAAIGEYELRADVMRSISELQLRTGRQLEAVATMQAGLDGLKQPGPRQRLVRKLLQMPFKFLSRT